MKRIVPLLLLCLTTPAWGYPGQTIREYLAQNPGFSKTGGMADPVFGRVDIYESKNAKEYQFSQHLVSCDPFDTRGMTHLPKKTLLVKGSKIVCEREIILVSKEEALEKEVENLVPYLDTSNFTQKIKKFLHTTFQTPLFDPAVKNGVATIYRVPYAKGQAHYVLMLPNLETLPESHPKGTVSGGTLKRIFYLTPYENLALGDLASYIAKKGKMEKE